MLNAASNRKILMIKRRDLQLLGKKETSLHNFCMCSWVYFLQSRLPLISMKCFSLGGGKIWHKFLLSF